MTGVVAGLALASLLSVQYGALPNVVWRIGRELMTAFAVAGGRDVAGLREGMAWGQRGPAASGRRPRTIVGRADADQLALHRPPTLRGVIPRL